MNLVIVSGTIFRVFDARETKNGTNVRGGIIKAKNLHDYESSFTISAWGKLADALGEFDEGDRVVVQGELEENSYKKDEEWIRKVQIKLTSIEQFGDALVPVEDALVPVDVVLTGVDDDIPF